MIGNRSHPDQIDRFLIQCGIPESELDEFYAGRNLRVPIFLLATR